MNIDKAKVFKKFLDLAIQKCEQEKQDEVNLPEYFLESFMKFYHEHKVSDGGLWRTKIPEGYLYRSASAPNLCFVPNTEQDKAQVALVPTHRSFIGQDRS